MSVTEKDAVTLEDQVSLKGVKVKSKFSVVRYITILNWLPKYTRLDAVSDFIAGFSLGLTLIPQSIAYAALAGLTAQYGLYSCLMGGFIYVLFGTIKEVSIGPSSLMSLLTLEYTRNMPVDFVVLFCFLAGCVELLMGVFRLGLYSAIEKYTHSVAKTVEYLAKNGVSSFLRTQLVIYKILEELKKKRKTIPPDLPLSVFVSLNSFTIHSENENKMFYIGFLVDFISMPVTSGFTSATSILIIVSQLQSLLGLRFKAHSIIDNFKKIFLNLENIRIPDFILGICSIAFLLMFRQLKDMVCCFGNNRGGKNMKNNRRTYLEKFLWFLSICRNALLILTTSMIAFYLEKRGSSPFILSGKIESGLPKLALPPFSAEVGNQTYTFLDMCSHYGTGIIVLPLVSVLANVAIAKAFANGSSVNATQEMLTLGLCNIFGSFVSSMPAAGAFTRSAVISTSGVRTPLAGIYVGTMTLLALSFLTPYFYYIPRAVLAAVLISAVVFIIDLKIIRLLWKGCKRDAIAAMVTFFVSVICGVELGLLVGALFSLIFFLRPPARPKVEVIQCKTELGHKYIILKPDTGLLYPAGNYFCNKVMDIIRKYDEPNVPFIIDCERIRNIDYTAIKGIELISTNINAETKKLWFLNVTLQTFNSIKTFANTQYFHFIHDEYQQAISSIFRDGLLINNGAEINDQLLENMMDHVIFPSVNMSNSKQNSETLSKVAPSSRNGSEETAFMSALTQQAEEK